MKTIYIDIETIPGEKPSMDEVKAPGNMKKAETIKKWKEEQGEAALDKLWHNQSLDSMKGQIFCVGVAVDRGEPHVFTDLGDFDDFIMGIQQDILWVGHNIANFDAKWLVRHGIAQKLEYPTKFKFNRYRGNLHDTMTLWSCGDWKDHVSLDSIARFLGVGKKTEGIDGSQVWGLYKQGRIKEIKDYCADDVNLVREVYGRLRYLIKD